MGSRNVPDRNKVFFGIPNADVNLDIDYARDEAIKDLEIKNQKLQDQLDTIVAQEPAVTAPTGTIGIIEPVTGFPFDGNAGSGHWSSSTSANIFTRVQYTALDARNYVGLGDYLVVSHKTDSSITQGFAAKSAGTGSNYSIPSPAGVANQWLVPHYIADSGSLFKAPATASTTLPVWRNGTGWSTTTQAFTIATSGTFMVNFKFIASVNNAAKTSGVVTLDTTAAHQFRAGDLVVVTGLGANFNGSFAVIDAPTTTSFRYALAGADVASGAVSGSCYIFRQCAMVRDNAGTQVHLIDPFDSRFLFTITHPSGSTGIRGNGTHLWSNVGHYSKAEFTIGTGITWTRPYTISLTLSSFLGDLYAIQGNGKLLFVSLRTAAGVTTWGMNRYDPVGSAVEINNTLFTVTGLATSGEPWGIVGSTVSQGAGIVQISAGYDTFTVAGSLGSLYYGGTGSQSPGAAVWIHDGISQFARIAEATLAQRNITNTSGSVVFAGVYNITQGGEADNDFVWVIGGAASALNTWSTVGSQDIS
jgi:hypothetical protein